MTDSSSLLTTNSIPIPNPVTAAPTSQPLLPNGSLSDTNIQDEEEYTIKCICSYADDDGNTVYCPKCDTWQHIECYYPSKKVPEDHFCADCLPRDLDAKRATERQRRHREAIDGGDRKVKRPTTKTQKKKHKDSNAAAEQINGWASHERQDSLPNGRDQPPPAKKPKTNHRASGSIVSINGESRKRALSNLQSYPSPSKSPQELFRYPPVPTYTSEFLELYDHDDGQMNASDNEHTIQVLNQLSAWRKDPSLVVNGNAQPSAKSPFVRADRPLDDVKYPQVSVETVQRKDIEIDGRYPTWRTLRTQVPIKKDEPVGEIRGEVGMLEEYCQQKSSPNRWPELAHPDPFVFFHPHMNIYVDARKKGTQFRYLRRSCRPNVTLKTFVSDDGEWRHFFVAREEITAGTELTAAWFLDPSMFHSPDSNKEDQEQQLSRQCDWVSRVLANFGDCACDNGEPCFLSRFDRRYSPKSADAPAREKAGRKRKNKSKHAISPMSTGQATNSRAGSETLKQDEDEQAERRSTTRSSPSDSRSRDHTPVNVAALDANPVLGAGLTAREIRKIQAVERIFEQGQSQQKKKKRTSGGSTLSTPNANSSRQLGQQHSPYSLTPGVLGSGLDQFSGSPPPRSFGGRTKAPFSDAKGAAPHSQPSRPTYRDAAVQTEEDESETVVRPAKRRKFMTPTQRLLRKVLADRERYLEQCISTSGVDSTSMPNINGQSTSPNDVEMKDAASGVSPVSVKSVSITSLSPSDGNRATSPMEAPVYPLPSQAAHSHRQFKMPPAPRLQLSTLPPVPVFPNITGTGTPSTAGTTPITATPSSLQSPLILTSGSSSYPGLGGAVTPSPAKKKLSLGDYMSRRNLASTPVTEKTQAQSMPGGDVDGSKDTGDDTNTVTEPNGSLQPDDSVKQEAAAQGGLNGSAIDDTPMKDEVEEPEYSPPGASPGEATRNVNPTSGEPAPTPPGIAVTPEVSQILAQLAQSQEQVRS